MAVEELEAHQNALVSWLLRGAAVELQLSPVETLTLIALLLESDELGRSEISTEQIADRIGVSRATIRGALHRLIARDLVLLASPANGRKAAVYVIGRDVWEGR